MSIREFRGADPQYTTVKTLGRGAFGVVTKVKRKSDSKVLACKSIVVNSRDLIEAVQREIEVLRRLVGCPNVVQWIEDVSMDPARMTIHLHMEYYPDGNLTQYIRRHPAGVPKDAAIHIWCCMTTALAYCHSKGILHRDIKPDNILISRRYHKGEEILIAYLADFGIGKFSHAALSTRLTDPNGTMGLGTVPYMAPEMLSIPSRHNHIHLAGQATPATQKTDIFSLGCVMFAAYTSRQAFVAYERGAVPRIGPVAEMKYGSRLSPLVEQCLALDPRGRIGTRELVSRVHEYLETRYTKAQAEGMWSYLTEGSGRSPSPKPKPQAPKQDLVPYQPRRRSPQSPRTPSTTSRSRSHSLPNRAVDLHQVAQQAHAQRQAIMQADAMAQRHQQHQQHQHQQRGGDPQRFAQALHAQQQVQRQAQAAVRAMAAQRMEHQKMMNRMFFGGGRGYGNRFASWA